MGIAKLDKKNGFVVVFIVISLLFILYFLPYFVLGKDAHILIYDNLDQLSAKNFFNGNFYSGSELMKIVPDMPGLQKEFREMTLSLSQVFFRPLGYFYGFIANEIIMRLVAFFGMLLLFRSVLKLDIPLLLSVLVSFAFTVLPFWPQGYLSVAGIPFVMVSFFWLYKEERLKLSFIILLIYSFYSSFVLVGIFELIILSSLWLYLAVKEKKVHKYFILGIVLFTLFYLISHYRLFFNFFVDKVPTNRAELALPGISLLNSIWHGLLIFLRSQYHAHALQTIVIIPFLTFVFGLSFFKKKEILKKKIFLVALGYIIFAAFIHTLYAFNLVVDLYAKLHLGFNWARFFFLSVPVWFVLFGLGVTFIYKHFKMRKIIMAFLITIISFQIALGFVKYTSPMIFKSPSYRDFISKKTFDSIKRIIHKDAMQYRVGCLGFFPVVAKMNGLRTVGCYRAYYPLSFKHKFRGVIAGELALNKILRKYYDNWGGRIYLTDDEIGYNLEKRAFINALASIKTELNFNELKKFGVTYLLSTVPISNSKEKRLVLLHSITNIAYYSRMLLYEIR